MRAGIIPVRARFEIPNKDGATEAGRMSYQTLQHRGRKGVVISNVEGVWWKE